LIALAIWFEPLGTNTKTPCGAFGAATCVLALEQLPPPALCEGGGETAAGAVVGVPHASSNPNMAINGSLKVRIGALIVA